MARKKDKQSPDAEARTVVDMTSSALTAEGQPLPVSGERVTMPGARSKFRKKPAPQTQSETRQIAKSKKQRKDWEASPEGQARTSNPMDDGVAGVDGTKWTRGQAYFERNRETSGPRVYDVQLPGMADPSAAPRPPRWEELPAEARAHTERALKMRGTSISQITGDLGTQLDQAHTRAWDAGTATPYASDFYERGSETRERIESSAKELGISPLIHAQMNAFTSPNTKFSTGKGDKKKFPNDEAAMQAVRWVQQRGTAEGVTNKLSDTGTGTGRAQGYTTNIRKAASAMEQYGQGVSPADWRFGKNEIDAFSGSPKTGPYANSWSDSHPQFTVSDVHTGGGGAFPHLGTAKQTTLPSGKVVKLKSGREEAIEKTPFVHSAIDYAMRQAMSERNMGSVRSAQGGQWGEEQLQRGESGLRGAPKSSEVYPKKSNLSTDQFTQDSLF